MMMISFTTMNQDYHEIDPSPLATSTLKWFQEQEDKVNPTRRFAQYCEENPWAPECKTYDV